MKKILISATLLIGMIAGAMVFSSFTTLKESAVETTITVSPEPTCKTAGNCSVNLIGKNGTYQVKAINYNDYKVTVNWTAIGYDSNGNKRQVGSGSLTCLPNNSKAPAYSSTFSTNCEDVGLSTVDVTRCD